MALTVRGNRPARQRASGRITLVRRTLSLRRSWRSSTPSWSPSAMRRHWSAGRPATASKAIRGPKVWHRRIFRGAQRTRKRIALVRNPRSRFESEASVGWDRNERPYSDPENLRFQLRPLEAKLKRLFIGLLGMHRLEEPLCRYFPSDSCLSRTRQDLAADRGELQPKANIVAETTY